MRDEFDDIKKLIRSERPLPREEARQSAVSAAMARFDENNAPAFQGTRFGDRLSHRLRGLLKRSGKMSTMKLSHVLMAGTSLAVLAFAVVNTGALYQTFQSQIGKPDTIVPGTTPPENESPIAKSNGEVPVTEPDNKVQKKVFPQSEEGSSYLPRQRASELSPDALAPILQAEPGSAGTSYMAQPAPSDQVVPQYRDQGRDRFTEIKTNPVKIAKDDPVSTFSIDVDTASYSFVRGSLNQNVLPQKDAVRVEEMINYFPYDYSGPTDKAEPFKATVSVFPTPWNPDTKLLHVGIKGFSLNGQEKPKSNLVFLLDTSGSMDSPDKLPLLVNAFKMLVDTMGPEDTVSIVTYAGSAGTVLEPTKGKDKAKIISALDRLMAGGSTAGAEGIRQAYQLAEQSLDKAGVNRIILATDGDFNVGITDPDELKSFVERKREEGVYLSVLGFGRGNYNDEIMQTLAQNGNGNASYIDTLNEARKVLVDEASSTLFPIANDVKIQVEFNPQTVSEYRLVGYETRMLNNEDFNNDKVDAGDVGVGHTVTAIYEIVPKDSKAQLNDALRYGAADQSGGNGGSEYAFVKIRYKLPGEKDSKLITQPVKIADASATVEAAPREARFAAAVAAFGQLLRGGQYTKTYSYDDVIALANGAKGDDPFGYRTEFVNLVRIAKTAQDLEALKP